VGQPLGCSFIIFLLNWYQVAMENSICPMLSRQNTFTRHLKLCCIFLRAVLTYAFMAHVKDSTNDKYLLQNINFQSLKE
jgi:hypothetical protein